MLLRIGRDAELVSIDRWLVDKLRRLQPFHITEEQRRFWKPILEKTLLNLSDQQLLTGLAIMIAGLWQHCWISVYHFEMIYQLAWLASGVHLVTLQVLYPYFRRRQTHRNWRALLMMIQLVMVVVFTVMKSHQYWYLCWTIEAQCLFDDLAGNFSPRSVWIVYYVYVYGISIGALYDRPSSLYRKWFVRAPTIATDKLIEILKTRTDSKSLTTYLAKSVILTRLIFVKAERFMNSRSMLVMAILTWYAIGVWSILVVRVHVAFRIDGNENAVTFGQLIPLFLLLSMGLVFREAYDGRITLFLLAEPLGVIQLLTVWIDEVNR